MTAVGERALVELARAILLQGVPPAAPGGEPLEWWIDAAGLYSARYGRAVGKINTGLHDPERIARELMRRLVVECRAESTGPGLWRPVADQGRPGARPLPGR